MRKSSISAVVFLILFVAGTLTVAMLRTNYPVLVLIGEDSIVTWLSGVMLVLSGSMTLVIASRGENIGWWLIAGFFLLLALDERFMYHELLKQKIIFAMPEWKHSWRVELPVIVAALVGAGAALFLWIKVHGLSRVFLVAAVALGTTSVVIDILGAGVIWEEVFKLLAELIVACILTFVAVGDSDI